MKSLLLSFLCLFIVSSSFGQDTVVVQTLTFDSTSRSYTFDFPDGSESYRQVLMQYRMRCKNGLVSTGAQRNLGCGEWDYSCNTYLTDSSRVDSVKATHPNYIIGGFSGTTFEYTSQQTSTYYSYNQTNTVVTGVAGENISKVGDGALSGSLPFNFDASPTSKTQFLLTAAELSTAGVTAGNIEGLQLDISSLGVDANFMNIRLKATSESILSNNSPEINFFQEVYSNTKSFETAGINDIHFNNAFVWDGTSNIIVEFSYTNRNSGTSSDVVSHDSENDYVLTNDGVDQFIELSGDGAGQGTISDMADLTSYQNITFETWVNPSTFSGGNFPTLFSYGRWGLALGFEYNSLGNLQLWVNNSTSYQSTGTVALNEWSHVALVYNRETNTSTFYINGMEAGTAPAPDFTDAQGNDGRVGYSDTRNDNYSKYQGKMDELRIWGTDLSQIDIQDWMFRKLDDSHPEFDNLVSLYEFDDASTDQSEDDLGNSGPVVFSTGIRKAGFRGVDIFKNFEASQIRPNIYLKQGTYTVDNTSITALDSVANNPNIVDEYEVVGTDVALKSSNSYYASGYVYVLDAVTDVVIDSVLISPENTITISNLNYYSKSPAIIELMSFVTPYGIGLDLGQDGKMWEFDMTDFSTVLRGNKLMRVVFTGAKSEELDIQFLFIKGTPPRDVINLQQVWKPGSHRSYTNLLSDRFFEPRDIALDPNASTFKLRTAITGHGQEGEFIPRMHYLNINEGAREVTYQVWKECADNAIYPQGGTWVYDRAGWCPGAPTDMKEYEIDPSTLSGNMMNLDYGIDAGSGTSNYYTSVQLVSYGEANFSNDAAVVDISKPSMKTEYMRFNPMCTYPVVTIQNTGSTDLTSLQVDYQVAGGPVETFNWTGNLSFMSKEEITLPISGVDFWVGDDANIFTAAVSNPNGAPDEYAENNVLSSPFIVPDVILVEMDVILRTNNYGSHNSYTIKDYEGNIVFTKTGLSNNTTYTDRLDLDPGCYIFELTDAGSDGLTWWANPDQGSGFCRFRSAATFQTIKAFNSDFGSGVSYSFSIGGTVGTAEPQLNGFGINLYPNPTTDVVLFEVQGIKSDQITIRLIDLVGNVIETRDVSTAFSADYSGSFDLNERAPGSYFIEVISDKNRTMEKVVLIK